MVGMSFVKDWSGLMAARFFLGVTESGQFHGVRSGLLGSFLAFPKSIVLVSFWSGRCPLITRLRILRVKIGARC